MKIIHEDMLINAGMFGSTSDWFVLLHEIRQSIDSVVWPPGNNAFVINPQKQGNGVKPIKESCMLTLQHSFGWEQEAHIFSQGSDRPGKVDAARATPAGTFVLEWETGNISSSHRSLNKIALGLLYQIIIGGVLILPTRSFYSYLTDRIGNYEEIKPYFPIWQSLPITQGLLLVIAIEHDGLDLYAPLIKKGTDGRALI
jgi:hypothetical protein